MQNPWTKIESPQLASLALGANNYFAKKRVGNLKPHHLSIYPVCSVNGDHRSENMFKLFCGKIFGVFSESSRSPDSANKLKFFWNKRKWFFCSPLFYLLFFLFSHIFCDFLFFAQFVFRSFSYSLHFRLSFSAHFFFRFSFSSHIEISQQNIWSLISSAAEKSGVIFGNTNQELKKTFHEASQITTGCHCSTDWFKWFSMHRLICSESISGLDWNGWTKTKSTTLRC